MASNTWFLGVTPKELGGKRKYMTRNMSPFTAGLQRPRLSPKVQIHKAITSWASHKHGGSISNAPPPTRNLSRLSPFLSVTSPSSPLGTHRLSAFPPLLPSSSIFSQDFRLPDPSCSDLGCGTRRKACLGHSGQVSLLHFQASSPRPPNSSPDQTCYSGSQTPPCPSG